MSKIGVIDDYEIIVRYESLESALKNIEVRFFILGEFLVSSRFKDVSLETIKTIKEMLDDWTSYNSNVDFQCQAIAFPTMVYLIDEEVRRSKK